jgi:hypothetical protein
MSPSLRPTCTTILLILLSGITRGQTAVDSTLRAVESLYTSGSYSLAELEARRLLENTLLGDSVSTVAEQWVAFALVAQGQPAAAREHFTRILRRQPSFELDPILTSPKILVVFNETKAAFRAAQATAGEGGAPPGMGPPRGITYRTILFPGWEQLYHRRTTAGTLFLGAGISTLGAGITLELVRRSARESYLAATYPDEITSKYQTYNRAYKAEIWAFAAFAAVYLASEIDVFLNDPPVSLTLQPADSRNRVNALLLSLSLR